jgi:hypothetical protein
MPLARIAAACARLLFYRDDVFIKQGGRQIEGSSEKQIREFVSGPQDFANKAHRFGRRRYRSVANL